MNNEFVPEKELDVYRAQIVEAEKYSTTLDVKTENDYQAAHIEAKRIKERLEIMATRKKALLAPFNLGIKGIKDLLAPSEAAGESALAIIKAKMTAYFNSKEEKANVKIDKIIDRHEQGRIGTGVANAKIMMATPVRTVVTEAGRATVSKLKKYYVVDKSLIPLQFMEPDMVKIKASYKAGTPVPGTEERLENNISIG